MLNFIKIDVHVWKLKKFFVPLHPDFKQQQTIKIMSQISKKVYDYRQNELNRLKNIKWNGYASTLREVGVSYIGGINVSSKLKKNEKVNVMTYCVYLAAADNAFGMEVCNKQTSRACRKHCLVNSGHNKVDYLSGKHDVQDARNKRTLLYFANRDVFCKLLDHEIQSAMAKAKRNGYLFSIRFNCTSDIPLTTLNKFPNGQNILERYNGVKIYDYTKRPINLKIAEQYPNYHVVLSYYKGNDNLAKEWLKKGNSIAVVFGVTDASQFPKKFMGYEVINGDLYDARFLDKKNCVVGLKYKVGKQDFKKVNGKYVFKGIPKSDLIVQV